MDSVYRKNEKNKKTLKNIALGTAANEVVNRYGNAANEFIKGYKGNIGDNNEVISKGLKQIAKSKVNEQYKYQNLKQQAGFSAEVHYENKVNAENIINGNTRRISRTDNVGMVNDTKFDFIEIDSNGNPLINNGDAKWGAQMKFCGKYGTKEEIVSSAKSLTDKLAGENWERYRGNDILVPSEQYEHIKKYAEDKANDLNEQARKLRSQGYFDKAKNLQEKANNYKQVAKDVKNSGISSKEAMFLREHPKLATIKEVGKTAHRAGMEQAKYGAIVAGVISVSQNISAVATGNKDIQDAIKDVAKDTATGAGISYVIAGSGSVIKSCMASSTNKTLQVISKGNIPSLIATTTLEVGKTIKKYINGELTELEVIEELGEKGVGMMASSIGASIGTAIFPGIGTIIGGVIGYMCSSSIYNGSLSILKEERLSYERRIKLEGFAKIALENMHIQQEILVKEISKNYIEKQEKFDEAFNYIEMSVKYENLEMFTKGLNQIAIEFGQVLQFKDFNEFDLFMTDNERKLIF